MKHSEIYDKHQDRRSLGSKRKRTNENLDKVARKARVSFKNYVREIKDAELEDYYDDEEDSYADVVEK